MRILHLLKHSVRGNGNVHVAVDLACEQADTGHEVTFVSARGSYDDLLAAHGVRVLTATEAVGAAAMARSALELVRVVRRVRPEVVHAHMMSSAVLGFLATRLSGAVLVTTVHNSFDAHSVLMRLGRVVIAVSEAERRLLVSRGFPARKVVTILNGPDGSAREELTGEDLGPLRTPSVTVLSGLHPRKAVGDVVEAFAQVAAEFPAWHLNIIGWGPSQPELEARVAARGLNGSVHFLGSTLAPRPLLEQSAIFATATRADPCPLTVGEARAAGCAVVGTAVGGIPELLDFGRAGLLVPPAMPAAMASAFRNLMKDPEALADARSRARRGAEALTVPRLSRDHLRVYASVVRHRTAPDDGRVRVAYFVPPSTHFAGIERVVHEIASGLAQTVGDRLDVHVVYASDYDEEVLRQAPYTRHVLRVARLRGLAHALRHRVAVEDFDVLVCPQVEASVIAWAATRGLRLPLFVPHLHGNPRIEETEGTRRSRIAFAVFRHVVSRRSAAVLAVSPSLARYAAGEIVRGATVHYAPNPVRKPRPGPAHTRSDEGPFRFVTVARLCRQKGQDLLLRALALARPDLPEVRLTLVGSGPDEAALRRLCTGLGLDDVVDFAGYVTDPAPYLREADCFVLPSRWEGFGVALVEALQSGLPVLATDCEFGPGDIVVDPRLGDLVAPDDPEALATGLVQAVSRPRDDDAGFRRDATAAHGPAAATASHVAVLRRIVATRYGPGVRSRGRSRGRLAEFAGA